VPAQGGDRQVNGMHAGLLNALKHIYDVKLSVVNQSVIRDAESRVQTSVLVNTVRFVAQMSSVVYHSQYR